MRVSARDELPFRVMLDVHVGFMDEEVRPVLETLMRRTDVSSGAPESEAWSSGQLSHLAGLFATSRPILVVERAGDAARQPRPDARADSILFEQQSMLYTLPWQRKVVVSSGGGIWHFGASAQLVARHRGQFDANREGLRCLAEVLAKELRTLAPRASRLAIPKGKLKTFDSSERNPVLRLTLIAFNLNTDMTLADAIIVVRAPEMGFQPNLVRHYLRGVLRSLSAIGSDMGLHVYGAGGAFARNARPGTVRDVGGSLYVGAEAVEDSELRRFVGIVGFCCPFEASDLFRTEGLDSAAGALDRARDAFHQDVSVAAGVREVVRRAKSLYPGKTTSLTASFFIPDATKRRASELGVVGDANMEDYHLLKVIHEIHSGATGYPVLRNVGLTRIDCDPPTIEAEVFSTFQQWAAAVRWNRRHYESAILWGLKGLALGEADWSLAGWLFPWRLSRGMRRRHVVLYQPDSKSPAAVLCPFYAEVACDLLAGLAKDAKRTLGRLLNVGPQGIESAALAVQKKAERIVQDEPAVVSALQRLVDLLEPCFNDGSGELHVWARPGWQVYDFDSGDLPIVCARPRGGQQRVRQIWGPEHEGRANPNVDRALYKSTNMIKLQTLVEGELGRIVQD